MVENKEEKKEIMGSDSDEIKMALQGKESLLNQGLVSLSITTKGEYVRISIVPPQGKKRIAHDIICVMDISGSMAEEALVKNKNGVKEGDGLTYLDLLKHASKTIIMNLNEEDRFALISYSDHARVECDLNYMTDEAKSIVINVLDQLQPENSTNIWDGVYEALEMAKKYNIKTQHQSILLLTDGEPNIFPPAGMIPQLEKYKKLNKSQIAQINTFAIGKHIDTPLLDQYAQIGHGQYCFIPCPGFIGTIFVNTISNILSTMANECKLKIEMLNGAKLIEVPGGYPVENDIISVGDIKFGQHRDIILKVQFPEKWVKEQSHLAFMNVQCKYFDFQTGLMQQGEVKEQLQLDFEDPLLDAEFCRVNFIDCVRKAIQAMQQNKRDDSKKIIAELADIFKNKLDELADNFKQLEGKPNQNFVQGRHKQAIEFITNIMKDVTGEVTVAVDRVESFEHWGQHFLPSLCHCHQQQLCNNFCDPGIQKYGGELFQEIKDKAELTFIKLRAPKPSKQKLKGPKQSHQTGPNHPAHPQKKSKKNQVNKQQHSEEQSDSDSEKQKNQANKQNFSPPPQPENSNIDMSNYYNAGGGCFDGNCLVKMADESHKRVKDIQKGDKIKSEGAVFTVVSVIEILSNSNYVPMVELEGGLLVTPKHPVKIGGEWFKPKELGEVQVRNCSAVYNFVLNDGHSMEVNNIVCATLGHGLKGEKVEHPYFGTSQIIQDLKRFPNFSKGFVQLKMNQFVRDQISHSICGIAYSNNTY